MTTSPIDVALTIAPMSDATGAFLKTSTFEQPPEFSFGTGSRPPLSQPSAGPGPGAYPIKTTMGRLMESNFRSPPQYSLKSRTKFGDPNARAMSKTAKNEPGPGQYDLSDKFLFGTDPRNIKIPKAKQPRDRAAFAPGPGSYEPLQSMGPQALSTKPDAFVPVFPKAPRPSMVPPGTTDIGPGQYGRFDAACEDQVDSRKPSCSSIKFGTGYKKASNFQKMDLSEPSPGPGSYLLPGGVATKSSGSPFRNSPAATISGRNKFGSPCSVWGRMAHVKRTEMKLSDPSPAIHKKQAFKSQRAGSGWKPDVVEAVDKLMDLAFGGNVDEFDACREQLSKIKPDILNTREEKNGCVPLHVAASKGNVPLISLLLRRKANVDAQDYFGNTALLYAIDKKRTPAALLLVKEGANVEIADFRGNSPLHLAAATENIEILDVLLNRGADPDVLNHANEKPLDKTNFPIIRRKLDRASQAKMDGSGNPKEQIANWMGFGIGLGVGLGIALAKQQQLFQDQRTATQKEKEDRERARRLASNANFDTAPRTGGDVGANAAATNSPGKPNVTSTANNNNALALPSTKVEAPNSLSAKSERKFLT